MQGFTASFPSSTLKGELRDVIRARVNAGLAAFENHGAYADLLITRRFSEMGVAAFAGDAEMTGLHKRVQDKIAFVESNRAALTSLAAAGDWDLFLQKYTPFERYESSFADLMAMHRAALEESAHEHARRSRLLAARQDYD